MTESQKWLILVTFVGVGGLLSLLAPVLTPFLISALLAYLGDPLVDSLENIKFPRTLAVTTVFVVIFSVIVAMPVLLIPLLEQQISSLLAKLPGYMDWLQQTLRPWLRQTLGIDLDDLGLGALQQTLTQHWQQAGGIVAALLGTMSRSGFILLAWMVNLVLIPVVTFYLLRDWDVLVGRIQALLPRRVEPVITRLARNSDEVLGSFLRGQMMVMLALGIIYTAGLMIVGLDLAVLIGMVAGVVSFVPYLGFIVGILLAGIAALMQFQEVSSLLWVAMVFSVGQALEGMLLTPLLVGDKIGLHPVAVIFAVLAGGQLFGFFGILLALPTAAVIMVLLRFVHENYVRSRLYMDEPQSGN